MSRTAFSVLVFGIYLALLGLCLMAFPNPLLVLFGLPPTQEVRVRMVGLLLAALSVYYIVASRLELLPILKITMYIRSSIIVFFSLFVALGWVSSAILPFAVIDLAGAVWTFVAMRGEGK